MKKEIRNGGIYGAVFAAATFATVKVLGFNNSTLTILLYLNVLMGIAINVRAKSLGLESIFGQVMVAVEDEEQKVKRLFTGEEYVINGNLEKVED
ncbi:MAG: hypothetical protein ABEK00_02755 [Candidatus Nanohaloarchaea archaeon]